MENCCEMKGFLTFLILRLISKKNLSGEEIRQELEKRKGTRPSPGMIYPVLKFLRENEFIKELEGSGKVKTYQITKKGVKEVQRATRFFCQTFYDLREDFNQHCR